MTVYLKYSDIHKDHTLVKLCKKCGSTNHKDRKFCRNCKEKEFKRLSRPHIIEYSKVSKASYKVNI